MASLPCTALGGELERSGGEDESVPERMVHVYSPSGEEVVLRLLEPVRVAHVKRGLERELAIPLGEMRLLDGTRELRDHELLAKAAKDTVAWTALTLVRASTLSAFLSSHGLAGVNAVGSGGSSALFLAASRGCEGPCLELLARDDFGAVNRRDFLGSTALHQAAKQGMSRVCTALLQRPDFNAVNALDSIGRSALHCAALRGHAEVCSAIMAHPLFDVRDAVDFLGNSAAELAATAGCSALARALETPCFFADVALF